MSPHLCTISTSPEGANTHCCICLNDRCHRSDNPTKGCLVPADGTSLLLPIKHNLYLPFSPQYHFRMQAVTLKDNSSLLIDFIKAHEILLVYLSQTLQHTPVDICHLEFVYIKRKRLQRSTVESCRARAIFCTIILLVRKQDNTQSFLAIGTTRRAPGLTFRRLADWKHAPLMEPTFASSKSRKDALLSRTGLKSGVALLFEADLSLAWPRIHVTVHNRETEREDDTWGRLT